MEVHGRDSNVCRVAGSVFGDGTLGIAHGPIRVAIACGVVWAALALVACSSVEPRPEPLVADGADAVADGADAGPEIAERDTAAGGLPEHLWVVKALRFMREEPEGVSWGFDLDATVSTAESDVGCKRDDFVDPDGAPGIDNQFARLLPQLENAGGAALEPLIQETINNGGVLILIGLEGVDDLRNDPDVTLNVFRGQGTPYVSTDGFIEPMQTFDVDTEGAVNRVEGVAIVDGVLEVTEFELQVPVFVFDYAFLIDVENATLRVTFDDAGNAAALLGGAITRDTVLDIAEDIERDVPGIDILLDGFVGSLVDLQPNSRGVCQALSTTVRFDAVPAFLYADSPAPGSLVAAPE